MGNNKGEVVTPELLRELLDYDPETGKLTWLPRTKDNHPNDQVRRRLNTQFAGREAFTTTSSKGYKRGILLNRDFLAHRVIWALHTGAWPEDQIDHVNGNRSDNRIENLRVVSNQENQKNQRLYSNNTSGYMGVLWNKGCKRWSSRIQVDGGNLHLGLFDDIEDAIAARKEAEIKHGFHENHGRD